MRAFFAQLLVAETRAELTVEGPDGETVSTEPSILECGSEQAELALILPVVRAWSPAAPNLYTLRLVLRRGGDVVDEFEDRFGFRTIETRGGHFYLNGEPLYIRAALDQDYYPDTICTTRRPSFSKTNSVRPRNSGSTACGVTSRRPTRDTTRSPTGWVC